MFFLNISLHKVGEIWDGHKKFQLLGYFRPQDIYLSGSQDGEIIDQACMDSIRMPSRGGGWYVIPASCDLDPAVLQQHSVTSVPVKLVFHEGENLSMLISDSVL